VERVRKIDQIKEDEMGWARDVLGVEEKRTESSRQKLWDTTWKILVQMDGWYSNGSSRNTIRGLEWTRLAQQIKKWQTLVDIKTNFDFHKKRGHSLLNKVALGSQERLRSIRLVSVSSFSNYKSLIGMETEAEEIPLVVCIYSGTVLRTYGLYM